MEDVTIQCPLCCGKTFNSREALVDHISEYKSLIKCPICLFICSTLEALSQHLLQDNCKTHNDSSTNEKQQANDSQITLHFDGEECDHTYTHNFHDETTFSTKNAIESEQLLDNNDGNKTKDNDNLSNEEKMYVELLNKPLSETFEMEKMQLMDQTCKNRYIIVDGKAFSTGNAIIQQNTDGTISIKKNPSDEPDEEVENIKEEFLLGLPTDESELSDPEAQAEEEKEVYTCNSCGVNFTSVLEHIQNHHKDEEVVVEVNETVEGQTMKSEYKIEPEMLDAAPKRVITATGCIVENENPEEAKEEPVTSAPPAQTRALFHQVVVKEMSTVGSGEVINMYYCTSCHTYVTHLDDFKSHPCKLLKYSCPHCPASYETEKALQAHKKTHASNKIKCALSKVSEKSPPKMQFKCDDCDTVFMTNKSLKLHKRMHIPTKSRLQSEAADDLHEKYYCKLCDKWIPIGYREIHTTNFHKDVEKFNCDVCNKKFESDDYLTMHMNVHNTEKFQTVNSDLSKNLPYDCVYCARKFARPHEKVKHERIHTGEKPHSCEICGKSFRVSYCLTLHMRTHTGARPYECKHCGKRFKAHSVYNHHLLTHSDVRAYKCPYCPKAFKTSVQLAGHKNSHTKPFSCKECNRPFASLYAVRVHTETHRRQNNLKFSCTLCGATYARTFALKDHMRQAHRDEVDAAENFISDYSSVDNGATVVGPEEILIGK